MSWVPCLGLFKVMFDLPNGKSTRTGEYREYVCFSEARISKSKMKIRSDGHKMCVSGRFVARKQPTFWWGDRSKGISACACMCRNRMIGQNWFIFYELVPKSLQVDVSRIFDCHHLLHEKAMYGHWIPCQTPSRLEWKCENPVAYHEIPIDFSLNQVPMILWFNPRVCGSLIRRLQRCVSRRDACSPDRQRGRNRQQQMQPLLAHHARGWVVWSPFLSTPDRLKMLKAHSLGSREMSWNISILREPPHNINWLWLPGLVHCRTQE